MEEHILVLLILFGLIGGLIIFFNLKISGKLDKFSQWIKGKFKKFEKESGK